MSYLKASLRIELYADDTLVASIIDEDRWEDLFADLLAMERRAAKLMAIREAGEEPPDAEEDEVAG